MNSPRDFSAFYATVALILPVLQLALYVGRDRVWPSIRWGINLRLFSPPKEGWRVGATLYLCTGTAAEVAALVGLGWGGDSFTFYLSAAGVAYSLWAWLLGLLRAIWQTEDGGFPTAPGSVGPPS